MNINSEFVTHDWDRASSLCDSPCKLYSTQTGLHLIQEDDYVPGYHAMSFFKNSFLLSFIKTLVHSGFETEN